MTVYLTNQVTTRDLLPTTVPVISDLLESNDEFRSACGNVSQCHQQQFVKAYSYLGDHAKHSKNPCAQIQQMDHSHFQYKTF